MAFRKYASLEQAQVLDLKGSDDRSRTASLEKLAEFHDYRTEDGYLYARIRAISSRVNKNHDGWPSIELAGSEDIFNTHRTASDKESFTVTANEGDQKYGFATFLGKPIFIDHNNSNPGRARGVIVDAKLHVEDHKTAAASDPYYHDAPDNHLPPTWVELLLEVDAQSFPKLASAIIEGSKDSKRGIDGFSMGCDVERSVCNICKNSATSPEDYCKHVKLKGAEFDTIDKHGKKVSRKSYEDCYGVGFFEISGVFDPADETALLKEVKAAVEREAAVEMVRCPQCGQNAQLSTNSGYGSCPNGHTFNAQEIGQGLHNPLGPAEMPARVASVHTADNPLPQSDLMTMPDEVDTLRKEEVCPVCGSNTEQGHQCDVCGYVAPPEGLQNPDLDKAKQPDPNDQAFQDPAAQMGGPPTQLGQETNPAPNNLSPVANVKGDMSWQIYHPHLAMTKDSAVINTNERPIKADTTPATNEPKETILSDQDKPVTNRTAASMIAAVDKENTMQTTAADAPTQDTKEDKRVNVDGVGGVMDDSNESASQPDTTTNVDGKGGVHQDSNQEASKPDHTESLPTASGDDSGFNKDKTTDDSGHTQTFDNSNEPESAVTQEVFAPWAAAKQGVDPISGPGIFDTKQQDRVDVESEEFWNNPGTPTDQWTGTGGNGVTKQQDPVTKKVDPNIEVKKTTSFIDIVRIADTEVELGITDKEAKYDRMAELERMSAEEIQATSAVLSRVKTAGLRKNASTTPNGVGRVPSMQPQKTASVVEADESLFM